MLLLVAVAACGGTGVELASLSEVDGSTDHASMAPSVTSHQPSSNPPTTVSSSSVAGLLALICRASTRHRALQSADDVRRVGVCGLHPVAAEQSAARGAPP